MGIDPGETTGWAVCRAGRSTEVLSCGEINGEDLLASGFELWQAEEKYSQYRATCLALMQILMAEEVQVVVIEDFTLRQMTTTKPEGISPVRIGAMLMVWLHEILPEGDPGFYGQVYWQTPSQAKSVLTDKRMRDLGLWQRGLPHATDAVRHCDLYRRRMFEL